MNKSYQNFNEKVKYNLDLVNIASEYVNMEKSGKNYKGLCPFHQEKTPSFMISPDKQLFYCFGCNKGGDIFDFIMEIENITFKESLKILAERAGLELPNQSQRQKQRAQKRDKLFEINNLAARFYHYILLNTETAKPALKYLRERDFTEKDLEKFSLGYAPDKWKTLMNFLLKKGYSRKELKNAGLIQYKNENYYDRFRGRIIFPIFNIRGEVLAFGARLLNEKESSMPKYLNSPGTLIYNKGDNLYGINWAKKSIRKTRMAIIMEGYTDVLTAQRKGLKNTVASLGTSLTSAQARLLKRYAEIAYIAYDADAAGAQAALRGLDILKKSGIKVKVIRLPVDQDPDDYLKDHGVDKFKKLQESALSLMDFKINQIINKENQDSSEDKISLSRKLLNLIVNIEDAIEQDIYIEKIADKLNLREDSIRQELKKYKKDINNNKKNNTAKTNKTNSLNNINKLQEKILKVYIDDPEFRDIIQKNIKIEHFTGLNKKAAKWLFCNNIGNISSGVDTIKDSETKDFLLSLTVKEDFNQEISLSSLKNWLSKLKNNILNKYKQKIYNKLSKNDFINLETLNNLLTNYKKIISQERGELNEQ